MNLFRLVLVGEREESYVVFDLDEINAISYNVEYQELEVSLKSGRLYELNQIIPETARGLEDQWFLWKNRFTKPVAPVSTTVTLEGVDD